MKKVTMVHTDDPEKRKFTLTVTGLVEKVVTIEPRSVYLQGNPGDTLKTTIKITPSEKYQFSILGLEQKNSAQIKAKLIAPKGNEKSWQVKVETVSDKAEPGQLYDTLTLKTDSKYRPSLFIRVYAIFVGKQKAGS